MIMMMMTMMTMTVSRKHLMKPNYKSILGYAESIKVSQLDRYVRIINVHSRRGTLRGIQYRNTVRNIGKYRNTVSKMDEIPIPHL